MMQLDFLQDEATTKQEDTAPPKNAKRPQRQFPVLEKKEDVRQAVLPELPQSLRPPFIAEETIEDEAIEKAPGAFKTISETAKLLDVPQHVLRFWESRFSQIKPLKLNGGRRYYRPQDIDILTTIKHLLYKQGYTIKGAKKAFFAEKQQVLAQVPQESEAILAVDQDKQQLHHIRQELMVLRDSLREYINK